MADYGDLRIHGKAHFRQMLPHLVIAGDFRMTTVSPTSAIIKGIKLITSHRMIISLR